MLNIKRKNLAPPKKIKNNKFVIILSDSNEKHLMKNDDNIVLGKEVKIENPEKNGA